MEGKQLPRTLQELLNWDESPDVLLSLSLEELEQLHSIASEGTTKPARRWKDLLEGRIKAKRKEQKEPIANSAKVRKAPLKPAKPAKAEEEAEKKAEEKAEPEKKSKKPASKREKAEKEQFPEVIESERFTFRRMDDINDVETLMTALVEHPYQVFAFMDEQQEDGMLTQFLVVYASKETVLMVDKSRKYETYLHLDGKMIERKAYIITEGKQEFLFPFSIYIAERKPGTER